MSGGSKLRKLMGDGMVVAPGAYDGLTARLISQADFAAVYMTGGGTSSGFGYPDYGLLTMSEMVENAGRIVDAVELPVISDADNGYGNELNTYRTIRAFEKAGVAGVHIEDQAFPKKCDHLDDKELIPLEDYVAKISLSSRVPMRGCRSVSKRGFADAMRRSKPARMWRFSKRCRQLIS